MENHDLLTAAATALEAYRAEERELEIEVSLAQARLEAVREFIGRLTGKPKPRRGRPPAPKLVELGEGRPNLPLQMPDRVSGGMAEPEPEHAA